MKKFILIACLFITHVSFGLNNPSPELKNEISQKLNIGLSEIQLSQHREDFVLAEFTVCDGKVCISGITGSKKVLIERVQEELLAMVIEGGYEEDTPYLFKFTFKKL